LLPDAEYLAPGISASYAEKAGTSFPIPAFSPAMVLGLYLLLGAEINTRLRFCFWVCHLTSPALEANPPACERRPGSPGHGTSEADPWPSQPHKPYALEAVVGLAL